MDGAEKYFGTVILYKTGAVLYSEYNTPRAKVEGENLLETSERRTELIRRLAVRKHDTMMNLASEFGVSVRTIQRDIDHLSLVYPIVLVRGRYSGGVYIDDSHLPRRVYLTKEEQQLLSRLSYTLTGRDSEILHGLLLNFAPTWS
ncbi:HTH domain-containing protein [uncultured Gemmiger sp.]|uniref:HTH domain-containing protein n=1 Tax=uncultured Gemmiger sp. TaxID=1623490 RepID=UPI0025FC1670|nr:HTH domain-containing protein [uncultured Gemmiger sp.]